jgi:hypothetical protein
MAENKSDIVRRLVSAGEYKKALSIAKGFKLGMTKLERDLIARAYECLVNPSFYKSLGRNTDKDIRLGIAVMNTLYARRENSNA